ncbi:MAG: hypothetical protein WC405_02635 [Syntrophales bacterium]
MRKKKNGLNQFEFQTSEEVRESEALWGKRLETSGHEIKSGEEQESLFADHSVAREKKSRSKGGTVKTFLLYLPNDLHAILKGEAALIKVKLHDYLVDLLKESVKLRMEDMS